MNPTPMPEDYRRLMRIARSDLAAADALLRVVDSRIRQEEICLHCHAALEKALKAIAFHYGFEPPFTHRLASLAEHLRVNVGNGSLPEGFDGSAFSYLDAYSAVARYEDLLPSADRDVASKALASVKEAVDALEAHTIQKNANN